MGPDPDSSPDSDQRDELKSLDMDRIGEIFGDDRFPVTREELVGEFGDVDINYPGGGSETLESVLETSGAETYQTVNDLQLAVLNGVPRDAVGRPRYSDRDPPTIGEGHDQEQSF